MGSIGAETVVSEDASVVSGVSMHVDTRANGSSLRSGDEILLVCEDKYMSVTKGWWMGWASSVPRKSGVFVVEIIEKVIQTLPILHTEFVLYIIHRLLEKDFCQKKYSNLI